MPRWRKATPAAAPATVQCQPGLAPTVSDNAVAVVWFKWSDLRTADHEPLHAAHACGLPLVYLHVYDPVWTQGKSPIGGFPRTGPARLKFWRESVEDLRSTLGTLRVVEKATAEAFAELAREVEIAAVYAYDDFCDEEIQMTAAAKKAAGSAPFHLFWHGLTLNSKQDLPPIASLPELYKPYKNAVGRSHIRDPLPRPVGLKLGSARIEPMTRHDAGEVTRPDGLPGRERWQGGESVALRFLDDYIAASGPALYVGSSDSMHPGERNAVNATTRLSPWLAFGCVSPRTVQAEVSKFEQKRGKTRASYWIYHELIFRDFFRLMCLKWGNRVFQLGGPFGVKGLEWTRDMTLVRRWIEGRTGFPFVDAGMRELATTGFCSHLHRQTCASFLVRDLGVDWRIGAEYFESVLVDYTPDANWGNWAYRILPRQELLPLCKKHLTTLEILSWPYVHDSKGAHIRRWVPELANAEPDDLREPWRHRGKAQKVDVTPKRDSPYWFTSVMRVNWPEYQQMMSGFAWMVKPGEGLEGYERPMVPPLLLEVDLGKIPLDHDWGKPKGAGKGGGAGKGKGKGKGKGYGKGQNR
eukprot:CAMPEP_0204321212 /NCGR_PEP_ID=MMETSP0469-20131031/8035_1 /ASSEMBLY_ACC=CAM_ASM_000384 /TAXON_ID=2969 /ORGANISM="Oxyrrhis marina" /LENGTH=580 /DNA_ID=CAMNT_0051302487 /DNA_START=30 /DNA_END=1772 /DNA_ORIENTATION=+